MEGKKMDRLQSSSSDDLKEMCPILFPFPHPHNSWSLSQTASHPQSREELFSKALSPPAASPSPATYANYPPTLNCVQQQSLCGSAVPYRGNHLEARTSAVVVHEGQQPAETLRNDNMITRVRPKISLLSDFFPIPKYITRYLPSTSMNMNQPGELCQEPEQRVIDLVSPPSVEVEHDGEPDGEKEQKRDHNCIVVPPPQFNSLENLGSSVMKMLLGEPKLESQQLLRTETKLCSVSKNMNQPEESCQKMEQRIIDLVTPPPREEEMDQGEGQEKEQNQDRDCVIVPPPVITPNTLEVLRSSVTKMLLGEPEPECQQLLRMETSHGHLSPLPTLIPQVKTLTKKPRPLEKLFEEANVRSMKHDILKQINKVDGEICKVETTIRKLKKKEQDFLEATCQSAEEKDKEERCPAQHPKHHSLAYKIYAENKRKAVGANLEMDKLGPKVELPLYNMPSDTAVCHDNKTKYCHFKKRLLEHLQVKSQERNMREKYLIQSHSRLIQEWHRKVDKIKSTAKIKAEEAKKREIFEKEFPHLKQILDERERSNRLEARRKSDPNPDIMACAVAIPPLVLDARQRRYCYIDTNGRIEDFAAEYKERQLLNVWTEQEKQIFRDKWSHYPKDFGALASFLPRKSISDCVQHYYRSKKEEDYRKPRGKRRVHFKHTRMSAAQVEPQGSRQTPF